MNQLNVNLPELPYAVSEAMNRLRINIKFCGKNTRKILLTSCQPNEGKSTISSYLWKMLAEAGFPTVLVDVDLRKSVMKTRFQMDYDDDTTMGLNHYLSGMAEYEDVIYSTNIPNGYMVPCTQLLENPSALLEDVRFKELLNTLSENYRFVIIDSPPLGSVSDGALIASLCDGAVLVVDAAQGIEAQTLANVYLALDHDLEVFPVINKIDLPSAEPERVKEEIEDVIGLDAEDAPLISAKNGLNIEQVLEQIVKKIPAPGGSIENPLQALIFDSLYDPYKGVIVFFRIMEGQLKKGTKVRMMATGAEFDVVEVGYFGAGQFIPSEDGLSAGMVGYLTASIKNVKDTRVGDTITDAANPCAEPLPGYKKVNPMVYCGLYPADGAKYPDLRDALEKLQLNDASLFYEPETSIALGFGFRCGFLGLLHLEIIQERLEREYNLDLVTTAPGVVYRVHKTNGEVIELTNPSNLPDPSMIEYMEEPVVSAEIMVTTDYIGSIMELCQERRGQYLGMEYMEETRALLKYELPLNEIIYDFFDALKSRSKGYASFDYELKGYEQSELVKLDILINREEVDALSFIVHKDSAYERGRKMCEKLKDEIPRHLFEIPIQAAVGGKIIARETVKAMGKDVLAKCYGGDISRKKKLLEKQKEGKKRMRQVGNVEIPQKAFMSVLKLDEN